MTIINSIKTKDVIKGTIKAIDKSATIVEKNKDNIVNIKDKSESAYKDADSDIYDYGNQKIEYFTDKAVNESINKFNKYGHKSVIKTKNNLNKVKSKIKSIKSKLSETKKINKTIKTSNKMAIKTTKKVTQETIKNTERARKVAQEATKRTAQLIKTAVKVTISTIKSIIAGTKALISLIVAGGWVAVVIILIITMVAILIFSEFGIFFSDETNGNDSIVIRDVIDNLNSELFEKINYIKLNSKFDDCIINYKPSDLRAILSIYSIRTSDNNSVILDNNNVGFLREIYWEVNIISYEFISEDEKIVLNINVIGKTLDEMLDIYNFSNEQRERVQELLSGEYDELWSSVIFGNSSIMCPVASQYTITTLYSAEHQALDIVSFYGDKIYSVDDGIVEIAADGCVIGDLDCNGRAGNYVVVSHDKNNYYSVYMHLKSINVKVNEKVRKGDVIGFMGNTGNVLPIPVIDKPYIGTHLHFELRKGDDYNSAISIDPSYICF